MYYWQILFELANRDVQVFLTQLGWYSISICLPSLFAGLIAHWLMCGNLQSFNGPARWRCWFASLISFLVMVVVGLASNWWEAKQTYHRIDWFVAALFVGMVAPFFAELRQLHAASHSNPESATRRRWIISLRSLLLLQLILLVAVGLWMGALREEIAERQAVRLAAERQQALLAECQTRFGRHGWDVALVFKGDHPQLRLYGRNVLEAAEGLAEIRSSDRIDSLTIISRQLKNEDLQTIYKLRTLMHLAIRDAFLDADSANIRSLKQLKSLRLSSSIIARETIEAIAQMPHLEELSIESSLLDDEDLTILCQSTSLKSLAITSPAITDRSLTAMKENRGLQRLMIYRSQISREGAAQLQKERRELTGFIRLNDEQHFRL